jgi:hypothetical protein
MYLYVLDVPELRPLIDEAAEHADAFRAVGDYIEFRSTNAMTIERGKAGVRRAVWFSAIGALRGGKVIQFDSHVLRLEPE